MKDQHDIKLTADELRAILFVLKSTPIDMGLYPLFINLQSQLKSITESAVEEGASL